MWTERVPGSLDQTRVRLVPQLPDSSCATIEAPPVLTVEGASTAAAQWSDGVWYLFVTGNRFEHFGLLSGPSIGVFRIDSCRLDRTDSP